MSWPLRVGGGRTRERPEIASAAPGCCSAYDTTPEPLNEAALVRFGAWLKLRTDWKVYPQHSVALRQAGYVVEMYSSAAVGLTSSSAQLRWTLRLSGEVGTVVGPATETATVPPPPPADGTSFKSYSTWLSMLPSATELARTPTCTV